MFTPALVKHTRIGSNWVNGVNSQVRYQHLWSCEYVASLNVCSCISLKRDSVKIDNLMKLKLLQFPAHHQPCTSTTEDTTFVYFMMNDLHLLSHLLIARCDIGVKLSVHSSVRSFVRLSVRLSTIYVKVLTL